MKIKEIITAIEQVAPTMLQEPWDNSGLLVGNIADEVQSALVTLDVTEAVVDDAIKNGENLILAHHPVLFGNLKKMNGNNDAERAIIKAIKNNIAIYAAHTNLDVIKNGVSWRMAEKLGLENVKTLIPQKEILKKLVVFVPVNYSEKVQNAIFEAGAGHIGNYNSCGFIINGTGSFKAEKDAKPFVGQTNELHFEPEVRFETVFPLFLQNKVINALLEAHPYEEVVYDIYPIEKKHEQIGLGVVGELPLEENTIEFLHKVKTVFRCGAIRHTAIHKSKVAKIALVGGAGSSFLQNAIQAKADVFITGDFKYHQFFDAENKLLIADIGHYESEQFTKELFYEIVTNKFSKFAVRLSEVETNPVKYLF